MTSAPFLECTDTAFRRRMLSVLLIAGLCTAASFAAEAVFYGFIHVLTLEFWLAVTGVSAAVGALAAVAYWLSVPYGWGVASIAVSVVVAVSTAALGSPILFVISLGAAPLAGVICFGLLHLPPARRLLNRTLENAAPTR